MAASPVREKEIVGVIRPNGSGKTTLLESSRVSSGLRHDCLAKPSSVSEPAEKILVLLT